MEAGDLAKDEQRCEFAGGYRFGHPDVNEVAGVGQPVQLEEIRRADRPIHRKARRERNRSFGHYRPSSLFLASIAIVPFRIFLAVLGEPVREKSDETPRNSPATRNRAQKHGKTVDDITVFR